MKKKYRIKESLVEDPRANSFCYSVAYSVQVRTFIGIWVSIKTFYDLFDPGYARREAEELLEKLEEK